MAAEKPSARESRKAREAALHEETKIARICTDCECEFTGISSNSLDKDTVVRLAGEIVCPSCKATRTRLVRELERIPDNLFDIKAGIKVKVARVASDQTFATGRRR